MIRNMFHFIRRIPFSPLICFGLAWLVTQNALVRSFEWRTLDWRTKFRTSFQPPPDPRIGVILFEDNTDAAISWPPDRSVHGDLLNLLTYVKPAVVAFDVILDATREGDGDAKLGQAAKIAAQSGIKVITASVSNPDPAPIVSGHDGPTRPLTHVEGDVGRLPGDKFALLPFPQLREESWFGFADTPPGRDGIRREIPLVVRVGSKVYASLGLQTLMAYYGVPADAVWVKLGDAVYLPTKSRGEIKLPISEGGTFLLNYRYDEDEFGPDFLTYSYLSVLVRLNDRYVEKKPGASDLPTLRDGIIFVGQTVTGKADSGPTPLQAYSPLVLVHANLLNNVLKADFAKRIPDWAVLLASVAIGYATLMLGLRRPIAVAALFGVLSLVVYVVAAYGLWLKFSLWLPMTWPIVGFTILQFVVISRRVLREQRARDQVKQMFGTYLSPQLVNRMIDSGESPQLGGHESEITAYFSDIQAYSSFSEKLPPPQLVELLNEYLTACTDIVQEEGGTLDKYIGDAVVAMFGAPVALPDHAYRAAVATVRVQLRLDELRAKWDAEGDRWPAGVRQMRSRIGLNSGPAIIGNMGSRTRFNYTMTGDNVNLAARMESGAKNWGVYSMTTEATKMACEFHGGDRVVFRPLGRIVVMGRIQAVPIHEVVGLRELLAPAVFECLGLFEQGLACYYARDWSRAEAFFRKSSELELNIPGKAPGVKANPSLIYLEMTRRFAISPPPASWDGVHVMDKK